jgi:Tol biopolymer transport system component
MTDERIDALIRRLDVPFEPDPSFVQATYAAIKPRAQSARVSDAGRIGRLPRNLRVFSGSFPRLLPRPTGIASLVLLLVLLAIVGLAIAGALRRAEPFPGGPLIFSGGSGLQAIDGVDGSTRTIVAANERTDGVSRSPNGRLIAFWTFTDAGWHLFTVDSAGGHRRQLGADVSLVWIAKGIDTWSPDSRYLASEVGLGDGYTRIIIADTQTGVVRAVTPVGITAHSPLWSPDGQWIAFTDEVGGNRSLAIIKTDGSGKRIVSGDVTGVAGPDTWSPDGWIYFGTVEAIYRANVAGGFSQRLVGDAPDVGAPTSSPDGNRITFIHRRSDGSWDVYIAKSDGTGAHLLVEHAVNDGWSTDGRHVLVEWTPPDQPGGLAIVEPDGTGFHVVFPFEKACRRAWQQVCVLAVGWGQPRP